MHEPVIAWWSDLSRSISQADPTGVGVMIGFFALGAGFASWRSWNNFYSARTIEDLPTAKARSAHQGYVEVEGVGRLMDGPPIIAPLSGLPCVWYRYRVEELQTTYYKGHKHRRWVTVDKNESTEVFWLEDDTGRIAVDPEGAAVTPKYKDVWRTHGGLRGFTKMPANAVAFLRTRPTAHRYRFTEERINPGDSIYAIGLLKNLGSHIGVSTVDDEVRAVLREWKQDQTQLKERFDLNGDGKIDQKEWRLAQRQARREVLKDRQEHAKHFTEGINLLTRTNNRRRPFLLSAYPQAEIINRYRRWAALYGAGFFVLGTATVWLFNTRFG
ncbi:MAG: GIDE domain-containing protein [Acidiferrobacterales bacterium]